MRLSDLALGDRVYRWVWTGSHKGYDTADMAELSVIKLGKVKVKVRSDSGWEGWVYPEHLGGKVDW